jgi:hypothetical protein
MRLAYPPLPCGGRGLDRNRMNFRTKGSFGQSLWIYGQCSDIFGLTWGHFLIIGLPGDGQLGDAVSHGFGAEPEILGRRCQRQSGEPAQQCG